MSNTPKNKSAQQRTELEDGSVEFEFDGNTYVVKPALMQSIDVAEAFEDNKIVVATRAMLGDEQWATFKQKKPTLQDLNRFWEAYNEASGQGNR